VCLVLQALTGVRKIETAQDAPRTVLPVKYLQTEVALHVIHVQIIGFWIRLSNNVSLPAQQTQSMIGI